MIGKIMTAAGGLAAVIALTACGAGSPAAAPRVTVTTTAQPPAAASPSASPAGPPKRLNRKQAARAYVRIVGPWNALTDAINRDYTDAAPFSQYRADARALVRALRGVSSQFRAVRWPARVQPYVTSMLLTYIPANVRCTKAGIAAGSNSAATTVNDTNQDCLAASDSTIPDTIRSMLGLPPRN
jgi:hypothetical protein